MPAARRRGAPAAHAGAARHPGVFKDNIDVLAQADDRRIAGLGGSSRGSTPRRRGHAAPGAIVLGKTNHDSRSATSISSAGGTIGNAHDPTPSTGLERPLPWRSRPTSRRSASHRHVQLAVESGASRRSPPSAPRVASPARRRHAAQHLSGCGRPDREVGMSWRWYRSVTGADAEDEATVDAGRHIVGSFDRARPRRPGRASA
jgi:hypothetical protein